MKHHDREHGTITVGIRPHGNHVQFSITDDGPGIPAEHRERVFKLFQTLGPPGETTGSGIGLAIVLRLVEKYGGSVRVSGGPDGRGCRFELLWPMQMIEKAA